MTPRPLATPPERLRAPSAPQRLWLACLLGLAPLGGLAVLPAAASPAQALDSTQAAAAPGSEAAASASERRFQLALARIREGGCQLRQAARNGEPALLQEAEREVVTGLLDALDADGADAERYEHLTDTVGSVAGLFKYVPYALEVRPGDGRPALHLTLRRSAYPLVLARRDLARWRSRLEGDMLVLTPRP